MSQFGCRAQCLSLVSTFPTEFRLFAAKVTVSGGFFVDRAQQVQHFDDAAWAQVKVAVHQRCDVLVRNHASPMRHDRSMHRMQRVKAVQRP